MIGTVRQMSKMLTMLSGLLTKAEAFADEKGLGHDALLEARLAPDMFTLIQQIQAASDSAKFLAARLGGVEPASDPDEEKTFDELQARLKKTIAFLGTFEADAFDGWAERKISLRFAPQMYAVGAEYAHAFAIPNFYFHVTTAYAILRHKGLQIGKRDFIHHMDMRPLEG